MTDLAALLRDRDSLETEAAAFRKTRAAIAALVHNPAYDHATRAAFAEAAGLPGPGTDRTPWTSETSPAPANAGGTRRPTRNVKLPASAATAAPEPALTNAGSAGFTT